MGLLDHLSSAGEGEELVQDVVITRVQVGGQQHVLFHQQLAALLHFQCHVVDKERCRVILGQDVDGELVPGLVAPIGDAEDDEVLGGVAVVVMVAHGAREDVGDGEHETLATCRLWTHSGDVADILEVIKIE